MFPSSFQIFNSYLLYCGDPSLWLSLSSCQIGTFWRSTRTHGKNVRQVRLENLSSPSSITQITRRVSSMGSLSSVTFGLGFRIVVRSAVWLVLEFDQSSTHTPTTPTYHTFFSLRFQTQTGVEKRNPTNPPLILFTYPSTH